MKDKPQAGHPSLVGILDHVRSHPLNNGKIIPVCIWNQLGAGTTVTLRNYAEKNGLEFKSCQPALSSASSELPGKQVLSADESKTVHAPPSWLPQKGKGILFIDEFNRAKPNIMNAFMSLLDDGQLGPDYVLPKDWQIVMSCSPNDVGYRVQHMDVALLNRMLNFAPHWQMAAWNNWDNTPKEVIKDLKDCGLSYEVLSGLCATPRTMEYFGALYEKNLARGLLRAIAYGLIGKEAAEEFLKMQDEIDE